MPDGHYTRQELVRIRGELSRVVTPCGGGNEAYLSLFKLLERILKDLATAHGRPGHDDDFTTKDAIEYLRDRGLIRLEDYAVVNGMRELRNALSHSNDLYVDVERARNDLRWAEQFVACMQGDLTAVMTSQVLAVHEDDSIADVKELMLRHDISQMPVVRGEARVGSITNLGVLGLLHGSQTPDLARVNVWAAMESPLPEVAPGASLADVGRLLLDRLAVLVVRERSMIGIITRSDLLRYSFAGTPAGLCR